ncbi:MAG TPA: hypothetical protein VFR68_05560 [Candidatus Dormibacteraeota bacterium]|nr:hypothetical protein [Candidatus Dormibacteraeota bacterium]
MNGAEIITKPTRALAIASGLIAATSIVGFAQDVTVSLGTTASVPVANAYLNAPTGQALLGGHQFDLTSGNMIVLTPGQSATINGSYSNASSVYLLINSFDTWAFSPYSYSGAAIGRVVLTFSDGTTETTTLTAGSNVREWRPGINTVNTATDPNLANVWSGQAQPGAGGGTAIIDMLTIQTTPLTTSPRTTYRTITSISIIDDRGMDGPNGAGLLVPAITIDPAATQVCIRPGSSSNACGHSQAADHSKSANFTSTPTAPGQLAKIDGTPAKANNKGHGHKAE